MARSAQIPEKYAKKLRIPMKKKKKHENSKHLKDCFFKFLCTQAPLCLYLYNCDTCTTVGCFGTNWKWDERKGKMGDLERNIDIIHSRSLEIFFVNVVDVF